MYSFEPWPRPAGCQILRSVATGARHQRARPHERAPPAFLPTHCEDGAVGVRSHRVRDAVRPSRPPFSPPRARLPTTVSPAHQGLDQGNDPLDHPEPWVGIRYGPVGALERPYLTVERLTGLSRRPSRLSLRDGEDRGQAGRDRSRLRRPPLSSVSRPRAASRTCSESTRIPPRSKITAPTCPILCPEDHLGCAIHPRTARPVAQLPPRRTTLLRHGLEPDPRRALGREPGKSGWQPEYAPSLVASKGASRPTRLSACSVFVTAVRFRAAFPSSAR